MKQLELLLKKMVKHVLAVSQYEGERLDKGLTLTTSNDKFEITIIIKAKNV